MKPNLEKIRHSVHLLSLSDLTYLKNVLPELLALVLIEIEKRPKLELVICHEENEPVEVGE